MLSITWITIFIFIYYNGTRSLGLHSALTKIPKYTRKSPQKAFIWSLFSCSIYWTIYSNGIQQYYHFFTSLMGILWSSTHGIWGWPITMFNHCASFMGIFWWALIVCGCNTFHTCIRKNAKLAEHNLNQSCIKNKLKCLILYEYINSFLKMSWTPY